MFESTPQPKLTDLPSPEGSKHLKTALAPPPLSRPFKKKTQKKMFISSGRVYVQATYNNTIITITDQTGSVIGWSSAGKLGFKGPKKSTPYAAGVTVRDLIERVREVGLKNVDVFVRGVGSGREAAVRALGAQGLNILSIKDITPIPHNGTRPPKVRRV